MSLDGMFLRHLKRELAEKISGAKIYKIYQPSAYEIVLRLRNNGQNFGLLMSCCPSCARINILEQNIENPSSAPAFCMLMRKRLNFSEIVEVTQKHLERVICIKIKSKDEMGFEIYYNLIIEIMGKHSNIILTNENLKIVDAVRRVTEKMSSKRLILPGIKYKNPPKQESKLCLLDEASESILTKIVNMSAEVDGEKLLSVAIMENIQGISKILCEWILEYIGCDMSTKVKDLNVIQKEQLRDCISKLACIVSQTSGEPFLIYLDDGKLDITFVKLQKRKCTLYSSFSELTEFYYSKKASQERLKSKVGNFIGIIRGIIDSKKRKIKEQELEIVSCTKNKKLGIINFNSAMENRNHNPAMDSNLSLGEDIEAYKTIGDLITCNAYNIKKGDKSAQLDNFWNPDGAKLTVQLDETLEPYQNAQKYYKLYKKAKTAQKILSQQIEIAKSDIIYLENTLDQIERAESEFEIKTILDEVYEEGYIKKHEFKDSTLSKNKKFGSQKVSFTEKESPSGLKILIGKSAKQNETLTYRIAKKHDLWFHVKDFPSSHVVLLTQGQVPNNEDILFAAKLCASHSKAGSAGSVFVDYTEILNVKKPKNYRPGMAIYYNYRTIFVSP